MKKITGVFVSILMAVLIFAGRQRPERRSSA